MFWILYLYDTKTELQLRELKRKQILLINNTQLLKAI